MDDNIFWNNAVNITSGLVMNNGNLSYKDIGQGRIGDCYFLAALAAVATIPSRYDSILVNKEFPTSGVAAAIVRIRGSRWLVTVDN